MKRRLATFMAVVLALSLFRTEAGEDQAVTVSPGTVANRTFSAEHAQPLWTLTVTPASGWAHKPETVNVNSSRWFIEDPGGGCEAPAQFECDTATQPAELQFQDRIFSGQLEPCTSSPGGTGGTIPGWQVTGNTTGGYFVLPEETNICLGSSATFRAVDGVGTPVNSSWSSAPSLGSLTDGSTVTVTPTNPDEYTITGTSLNNTSLHDAGTLTVLKVDIDPETTNVCACVGTVDFNLTADSYVPGGVTWSIAPSTNGVSIDGNGTVTFPDTAATYTITATSVDNPECFDTATLTASKDDGAGGSGNIIDDNMDCPPAGTFMSETDKCGNTLKLVCDGSRFLVEYNDETIAQCVYHNGDNSGYFIKTADGCRFRNVYFLNVDDSASWIPWPIGQDEGTLGVYDGTEYQYDCLYPEESTKWCFESPTQSPRDLSAVTSACEN